MGLLLLLLDYYYYYCYYYCYYQAVLCMFSCRSVCVVSHSNLLTCFCLVSRMCWLLGVVRSAAQDGGIVFWNRESAQHLTTLKNVHKSAVVACSWGSNDQLATVEREHSLVFWE